MEKRKILPRILVAGLLVIGAVIWAVVGMLLVVASARNAEAHGQLGTILLVVLWLGGLAACIGGAVRLVRPALQQLSTSLEKSGRKRSW
jgi:hypothetical protein